MGCDHKNALDLAKEGHWEEAHVLVQPHSDELSCLIHAYLHRVEGDRGNARYWYTRVGQEMPDNTLGEEFERLYAMTENAEVGSQD
jgi:hypothetical protein